MKTIIITIVVILDTGLVLLGIEAWQRNDMSIYGKLGLSLFILGTIISVSVIVYEEVIKKKSAKRNR